MPSAAEAEYLRRLGQPVPGGVDLVGPDDYLPRAEQELLFPTGLPGASKRGALGALALGSRIGDLGRAVEGLLEERHRRMPTMDPASEQQQIEATVPEYRFGPKTWMTGAPDAIARGERAQRQAGATSELAGIVGKVVKLVASAAAGGAAGGGGGAGPGASPGTAAGASSGAAGAGFGGSLRAGFTSGGGQGFGGFLGRLGAGASGRGGGGGGYGQLAQLAQMGGKSDEVTAGLLAGPALERRAKLARLGFGDYGSGLVTTAGIPWSVAG